MGRGILAAILLFIFSNAAYAEEIYCNAEITNHCGNPFFQMVSDGDNWKFMFISPDMVRAFQEPFTGGEDFLAIHFEIPKKRCSLVPNRLKPGVPGITCNSRRRRIAVTFQTAHGDIERDLFINLDTTVIGGLAETGHPPYNEILVGIQLSDDRYSTGASGAFRPKQCPAK